MEFLNSDGKKLRKKDKEIYYRLANQKLVKIPSVTSDTGDVKKFVMVCMKMDYANLDVKVVDEMWDQTLARNKMIVDALEDLKSEAETNGDIWKSRAYSKAIKILAALKIPIVSGTQAQKLDGVGPGIAAHITEIIKTGRLKSIEERSEDSIIRQITMEKFMSIWGVGPKHAKTWYTKGHRDIEDLVSEKLTEQQKVGVKYYEDLKLKIPRAEAEAIFSAIKYNINKKFPQSKVELVGSYRRGAEEMGDLDIMVSHDPKIKGGVALNIIINLLTEQGIVTDAPVLGAEKFMGIAIGHELKIFRRVDIRMVPVAEWGTSLLHHTGSDSFNKQIRLQASQMGYKLSEKGLFKLSVKDDGDELIPTLNEKDVLKILDIPYVEPKDRN